MRKVYSDEEIALLARNTNVLYVGRTCLVLTLGFKRTLYEAWEADPRPSVVRRMMLDAGIDERSLGRELAHDLTRRFKVYGRPRQSNAPSPDVADVVRGAGWLLEHPEGSGGGADGAQAHGQAPRAEGGSRDRARSYSDDEVALLARNPNVLYVGRTCLILTLGFRREAYDAWEADPRRDAVRAVLADAGIEPVQLGRDLASDMVRNFERHGRPSRSNVPPRGSEGVVRGAGYPLDHPESEGEWEAREALLGTGRFVVSGARVWPSPALEDSLFASWPREPVSVGLAEAGYDEAALHMGLAPLVEARFRDAALAGTSPAESRRLGERPTEAQAEAIAASPFVEATASGVRATPALVASAAVLHLAGATVDEALEAHLVDRRAPSVEEKAAMARALAGAEADAEAGCEAASCGGTVMGACVLARREALLERLVRESLAAAGELAPALAPIERRRLCEWAGALPEDPAGVLTRREVMGLLRISKTSYYRYLKDESWGTSSLRRAARDDEDARSVRRAFEPRGFRKGARQVCMLIPRLGLRRVGLRRVRRIMRALGLESGIRAPNPSRRAARAREGASVAPNLLRRRFRLHRPNEVRVTDVTTLDYGDGLRAYGSALMDPVDSVLVAFVVSDSNDLGLALDTLRAGDAHPCCEDGGIIHSDQGVLYKADGFLEAVASRGLERSMSKLGNCWDNATVESFFGHFKDECDYARCSTLDELRALVADYADYHNNERGMWDRMRMTPREYEAWLSGLDEAAFAAYLEREEAEWEAMRAGAAERARRRYGTLGA